MPLGNLVRDIADAYSWHRSLGNQITDSRYCRLIADPSNPDVWSSNHVSRITASLPEEVDAVFADMERHFAHCTHRLASVDCFTPPLFVARLAMLNYQELSPTLQMVLTGKLAPISAPPLTFREVVSEDDWQELGRLVEADHREGERTNRTPLSPHVTRGIVQGYRKKTGQACRFFTTHLESTPCGYGSAILCPNGLGMIEDLFTLRSYRGKGVASALIRHCVEQLRLRTSSPVFLGSHAAEQPKHLYNRLGFEPVLLTREYLRQALVPAN